MNKKKLIILGIVLVVIISGIITGVVLNVKKSKPTVETKEKIYKTYDMYIKINPLVRLTFQVEYEECEDPVTGVKNICPINTEKVTNYELINNDAKDIYDNINFKNKSVMDSIIELCDVARANKVAYDSISVTTNWEDIYDDEIIRENVKNNSKYKVDFDIFIDIREHINNDTIVEELENEEIKSYIITFDRDNGDSVIKRKVKENTPVEEVTPGKKDGYEFVEWQLNGQKYDFKSPVLKDITLKAKWNKSLTTTTTTTTTKKSTEKSTEKSTNKTTSSSTKKTTTKPNYSSTIDKINLNENILVYETYNGTHESSCSASYYKRVFATNADSVLGDYKDENNYYRAGRSPLIRQINYLDYPDSDGFRSAVEKLCETVVPEFNRKVSQLQYDTAKEKQVISLLEKLKNNKIKGVSKFEYNVDNHSFSYNYLSLYMENHKSFGEFGKQFNKLSDIAELDSAFKSIVIVTDGCAIGGCGSYDEPEPPLVLNEALCNKYNLTCGRW